MMLCITEEAFMEGSCVNQYSKNRSISPKSHFDKKNLESEFMVRNVPRFLDRFDLTYNREDFCIEYFISRHLSIKKFSYALVVSFDKIRNQLHVAKFCPQLMQRADSKYHSSVCFYLMIYHSVNFFLLDDSCHITLKTQIKTYEDFYKKLKDFNFHKLKRDIGGVVELISDLKPLTVKTDMIAQHIFQNNEIPFS
jgi:hypothetical protein